MASALQLTAQATINSGQGLAASANLLSQISTFVSHDPIVMLANAFTTATTANALIVSNVTLALESVGSGVTQAHWLLDLYPGNVSPTSSGSVSYYGNNVPRVSGTLQTQAQLPFAFGMSGFANVYSTTSGYANSIFDTVSSVYLLKNKTYAQSGLGYTGRPDLISNGIGYHATLLSNIVSNWGTMYDITNINKLSNPYVFGQNLLNQGLGSIGGLADKLTAAGLNIDNLLQIPQSRQLVTQKEDIHYGASPVGELVLPTLANVVTTISVTGNSPSVVLNIYKTITGSDLAAIVSATNGPTNDELVTLADYLDINKVVAPGLLQQLNAMNITDFAGFAAYLQSKLGQGYYKSWDDMGEFLLRIEVPEFPHSPATTGSSLVLSPTIANNLLTQLGTGSGPFENPIITDYLGACAGVPYTDSMYNINRSYDSVNTTSLLSAVTNLDTAVTDYVNTAQFNLDANLEAPDISPVTSAVSAVNSALNAVPGSAALSTGTQEYYKILNAVATEVSNLHKAGAVFNAGSTGVLNSFAGSFTTSAADKIRLKSYQFFKKLITDDAAGEVLTAAIAEDVNTKVLGSKGIELKNDPMPGTALYVADAQNIPLSTYLSQNK